jgi:hypothetical protein
MFDWFLKVFQISISIIILSHFAVEELDYQRI